MRLILTERKQLGDKWYLNSFKADQIEHHLSSKNLVKLHKIKWNNQHMRNLETFGGIIFVNPLSTLSFEEAPEAAQ